MLCKSYQIFGITSFLALMLDQLSKMAIVKAIPLNGQITVIPGIFDLVNIRNRGAAFGFLNREDIEWQFWLFLFATLIAIAVIMQIMRKERGNNLLAAGLGLILGGALGNLTDRIRFREVIDFLDFYWHNWHWPAFNIADTAICLGAFITCICLWRQKETKNEV